MAKNKEEKITVEEKPVVKESLTTELKEYLTITLADNKCMQIGKILLKSGENKVNKDMWSMAEDLYVVKRHIRNNIIVISKD